MNTSSIMRLLVLVLAACNVYPDHAIRYDEDCEASPGQAEWVLQCITNGNPMSDEEGEDLVDQCELSSRKLFTRSCKMRMTCWRRNVGQVPPAWCEGLE